MLLQPRERCARNDLIYSLQGLELLVTVLLARNRQPPTVAAGGPHAELAAALITLPSGLLAMVCAAIGKLKARRAAGCACVGVRVCTVPVRIGQCSPPRGGRTVSPRSALDYLY